MSEDNGDDKRRVVVGEGWHRTWDNLWDLFSIQLNNLQDFTLHTDIEKGPKRNCVCFDNNPKE